MSSRIIATILALALTIGAIMPVAALAEEATESQKDRWRDWVASEIKQSWIDMYAREKGLDPALIKWSDLPEDLRQRFERTFGDVSSAE